MPKPNVFIVDDEQDILENYYDILSDQFQVTSFQDPAHFLKFLENPENTHRPDLLITDLKMPAMDGLEMIRKAQAQGHFFPFILLSGYLDKNAVMDAVELGAFRLMEKPCEYLDLLAAIDELMIEHDIFEIRKEVRSLTSQLRELYTSLRMIMVQYIPPEILTRLVVDAPEGEVREKMSFDDLLENLEARLKKLLDSEKVLVEMKNNRFKT